MKRTWKVLLVCVVAVAALAGYFFLLPAPAGGEDFQLLEVRQDGRCLLYTSTYTFAVRNNSSYKVSVSGFVNY